MAADEERIARNEALFREVNERTEETADEFGLYGEVDSLLIEFVCECGNPDCIEKIELTRRQYEAVRSHPARFVVIPGHEDRRVARAVEEHARFVIVEKVDEAAEIAIEYDPRR